MCILLIIYLLLIDFDESNNTLAWCLHSLNKTYFHMLFVLISMNLLYLHVTLNWSYSIRPWYVQKSKHPLYKIILLFLYDTHLALPVETYSELSYSHFRYLNFAGYPSWDLWYFWVLCWAESIIWIESEITNALEGLMQHLTWPLENVQHFSLVNNSVLFARYTSPSNTWKLRDLDE